MVRWDSPLVTVAWDEPYPLDTIWELAMTGDKKGPTAAVKPVRLAPSLLLTESSPYP